jgi:RNA polymerase sigma-70 factor (ECF subfamily)
MERGSMASVSKLGTRVTLLNRLRLVPKDPAAWGEFVNCYGRKIYEWCRGWGLQPADAQDVTQNVFLNLTAHLSSFQYNPQSCFRAWLKTVTHHAWHDFVTKRKKAGIGLGGILSENRFAAIESRDDLVRRLSEACDEEVYREAAMRVQLRVEPRTWEAFYQLAIENRAGAATAANLGMKVATVFVCRSKVQRMLSEEIARLEKR